MDKPGTTVSVPSDQAQQQSDVLNGLCNDGGVGTCSYLTKSQPVLGYGNAHLPTGFSPVINNSAVQASTTISITDTQSTATSWQVKIGVKLSNVTKTAEASIETTFGQTVTETHTFTQSVTAPIPPGAEVFIFGATPVYRYYGDWQVIAGNTTWTLKDVWFDTPNPAGNPVYVIEQCEVGSQQCTDLTQGKIPPNNGLPPSIYATQP